MNIRRTGIFYLLGVVLSFVIIFFLVFYYSLIYQKAYLLFFALICFGLLIVFFKNFQKAFSSYIKEYYNIRDKPYKRTWEDLEIRYTIKILNQEGDAKISRISTVINKSASPIKEKYIKIFSDGSDTPAKEMNLTCWVEPSKSLLRYEFVADHYSYKLVRIFTPSTDPTQKLIYGYEFSWKKMFPSRNEWFEGTDASKKVTYNLLSTRALENITIYEMFEGNITQKKPAIEEIEEENYKKYPIEYTKNKKNSVVRITWSFKDVP